MNLDLEAMMFKKSKIKIVISIMLIMIFLLAGTIGVIFASSYKEMEDKDKQMLSHYVNTHNHGMMRASSPSDIGTSDLETPPPKPDDERAYDTATIYSVKYDSNNKVIEIDNNKKTISNKKLKKLAQKIKRLNRQEGQLDGYYYRVESNNEQTIVAFMDRSNFDKSINTLLKYTLIFGAVAIIVILFLAIFLANIIIRPLERSHNMQKRFISDAGHELKTPVTVISTNAEVLSEEIGDNRWLDNIVYENKKMSTLIKQLMTLVKTEERTIKLEKVDMSHLVVKEVLPFESVAYEKGITIDYEEVDDNIFVLGNSAELGKLISILVDNAISHSTEKNVDVKLSVKHGKCVLTVINGGEPIPEEKQKMLFDRFYRVDESRNSEGNHYGLGLSIAKSIVDAYKGNIRVECINQKVVFEVTLKLAKK